MSESDPNQVLQEIDIDHHGNTEPKQVLQEIDIDHHGNTDMPMNGHAMIHSIEVSNSQEDIILDYKRKKDWLENQKHDHVAAVSAAENSKYSTDQETVNERISTLESELLDHSISQAVNEKEINSIICGSILSYLSLNDKQAQEEDVFTDEERQQLREMFKKKMKLESQILKENQETDEIQTKLDEVKQQCLKMKKINRELMSKAQDEQSSGSKFEEGTTECEHYERIKEDFDAQTMKVNVVRGILNGVIVGSGVHWAEDPDLLDTVIDLGQPLDTL